MGLFKTTKLFCNVAVYTDAVANSLMSFMRYEGYEVDGVKLPSGDWDISIKKGDLFKAVLGLQTALKISISPTSPHVYVKAGVGIFGQQVIPTVLTVCVWWPFAIPQIWGIIKQSKLDRLVMDKIQSEFNRLAGHPVTSKVID
ncbi:hypothetical protein [Parabacteroides pacaensis]|uniref:hypothetical protein n=1 Tax=Parabacteroides pacaensis TaxID=2086575 RepID=UPI000D0EBE6D|nr:hypothetical protein [Parabacteroides pacaensis]